MIRNIFSLWFFVFLVIGFVSSLNLAFAQTSNQNTGFINGNIPYYTADAKTAKAAPVTVYKKVEQYSLVTWNTLAHFDCDNPDDTDEYGRLKPQKKQKVHSVPGFINALNGASVAVVGFMLPMDMDDKGEKTTGFIMCRTQSACCYGIMPKLNEWIYVTMPKGKAADIYMDIPVTAFGTLSAGEINDKENGWSFYRMIGDKVGYPKEIW
jgi:hypothetical protein